jgi:hypothetical protein
MGHPHSVHNVCMEEQIIRVVERQSAISPRCLAGCTLTACFCILYITRSEIVSISCSDCVSQYHAIHQWAGHSVNVLCNSWLTLLCLKQRFYLQMNCGSLGLESTFAMNMCGWMKILMQFNLIISNDSFPSIPSTMGLAF